MPIAVPAGVTVTINPDEVVVKGPKGELRRRFNPEMVVTLDDSKVMVARPSDSRMHRSLHGLTRSLLSNMVQGVSQGFEKGLEIVGVGYRVEKSGDKVLMRLGFSHPLEVSSPPGISLAVEGANRIKVSGIDKEAVGETAANIRALRPLDSYKGKGIKYLGETVRLKSGKAGKAIGKKE